jgi:Fe-S cluster assembly ATP-binding protein
MITHYFKVLDYLKPDRVYVLDGGRLVKQGGIELAEKIEKTGYVGL